jgi:hypothetical protein
MRRRSVAKTLRVFSRRVRTVLADLLQRGQVRGEIDNDMDMNKVLLQLARLTPGAGSYSL